MSLSVSVVEDARDLRAFIDFPYHLHSGRPLWVPPLRVEIRQLLSRDKNPFFEHGEATYFIARRGDRVVGRIAAVTNHLHNETHSDDVGFFGFFDCEDDQEVADALVAEVVTRNRSKGHRILRGPVSFSTNDECGVLVEGFNEYNSMLMPYNPPYYPRLLEAAGFNKAKDLYAWECSTWHRPTRPPERSARARKVVLKRLGLEMRNFDKRRFSREVETIKRLYNDCWEHNWGFVPMTDREVEHMASQFKPIVDPDVVPIVERNGEPVAFGLSLPDVNHALLRNRSGRLLPGLLRILWGLKRRKIRQIRVLLMGVIPEYRGKGVEAAMYHQIWDRAMAHGMYHGEAGWILEDNAPMNNSLQKMDFRHYKTYRLYDRAP